MARTKDLSPKYNLLTAEQELMLPPTERPIGENIGGLAMYGNSFKRGSGNNVFGADENGVWLGAADYADAPVKFSYSGNLNIKNGDNSSLFNADVLVFYEAGVPSIIIGEPAAIP